MKEVIIRGEKIEIDNYKEHFIYEFKKREWNLKKWMPRDALRSKDGITFQRYDGGNFDKDEWTLSKNSWDHDHCEICNIYLCQKCPEDSVKEGFTDGNEWLCEERYNKIVFPHKNAN